MEKYLVVVESGPTNFSAYSPDVSGCAATGKTIDKTVASFRTALAFHFQGIEEDGDELPTPKGLRYWLDSGEISDADILAFVEVNIPALA